MTNLSRKETLTLTTVLLVVVTMTSMDVFTDVRAGSSWSHVGAEVSAIVVILGILAWLWVGKMSQMRSVISKSEIRLKELALESQRWQEQVATIKPSLSDAIDEQFVAWQLTHAECEIARLILKGLANKEIAAVRSSSEQTIKQQTNAIYRKSGLTSRGQLSAFFLEDLF